MSERDLIKRDLERRIVARHKQWIDDSLELFAMADFSFSEAQGFVAGELILRACHAFRWNAVDPDRAGQMLTAMLRHLEAKIKDEDTDDRAQSHLG